ncbi:TetR/AcrR family transcriptional regulator [Paenibacillus senegalimassiliensis]|uniref:TetR/AcrR family transcriptional regulator n=1 Tax=Paenibacillus senegalimassiliensis TaxID=1737426 RepID=UPI00073ECDD1|nr:TetR/AcrR family transcriptional regulator [Paenibacillus senegalimassiliensis]
MRNNDTKQRLLEVTRQMIDKHGVDAVNMRDLGKEINLSRSAIYRHFRDKEDLLAAIVAENFESLNQSIIDLITEIKDVRELVYSILQTYYRYGIQNQAHYHLMFSKQYDKKSHTELYLLASQSFRAIEQHLSKTDNQTYKTKKSSKESTALMFAFIHGLVDLNASGHFEAEKGMDDADRLIQSFVDLIFYF